ncbi:signal peptidase II [Clostridium brassicae]|uniref:Lipoprotein signal peptidase n=1 Tax=Clostridium brassicae TaxID=2999072 RepID=A0ABT4DA08_9CLOT|nr:signal peptidase II [Clostridium brassicae]MCY6959141.1 signal peptidase II [Clostridium brassicae]
MLFFIITITIVILDRFSKSMAVKKLNDKTVYFMKQKIQLFVIENRGVAFSLLTGKVKMIIKVSLILLLAMIIYLILLIQNEGQSLLKMGISFMIGGGFSNLVDRILYEGVIDYIYINFKKCPVFNFADIFILIGSLMILISALI